MSGGLQLDRDGDNAWIIRRGDGACLWRYVFDSAVPVNESPRPYAHPIFSPAGDLVTNFRPNDHPWHHALSLTITSVDGVNFWGGPSHRTADGYQWRDDHGCQRHVTWQTTTARCLEHRVEWCDDRAKCVLLHEQRRLQTELVEGGWALRWTSRITNATDRELSLGQYESLGGLRGSHYTGLQFRGARDLLDEHGDATLGISDTAGRKGEAAVHGVESAAMEWSCQHDGSLRRTRIRFENLTGPLPWFVRQKNPLAAFAFHRDRPVPLAAGETLLLDHRLTFLSA